jgi:hypothetical protein
MLGVRISLRSVCPVRIWRSLSTEAARRKSESSVVKRGRSSPRQAIAAPKKSVDTATGKVFTHKAFGSL